MSRAIPANRTGVGPARNGPGKSAVPAGQRRATRRLWPWRTGNAMTGLLLFVCWFLPAVESCNSDLIPAKEFAEYVQAARDRPFWDNSYWALVAATHFAAAYWFGLLTAVAAGVGMAGLAGLDRSAHRIILALLLCCILAVAVILNREAAAGNIRSALAEWPLWCLFLLYIGSVLHIWKAAKNRTMRYQCHTWWFCTVVVSWFSFWGIVCLHDGGGRIGLYLSWIAATLLWITLTGEAAAAAGISWPRAWWRLLTCRIQAAEARGFCPDCGYNLHGLPLPRCPECGRSFSPVEWAFHANEASPTGTSAA